jgi:L-malate glycosyltransferase
LLNQRDIMNITFLLPMYPWNPAGGFKVVYIYANELVKRGHNVTILHPQKLPNWHSAPTNLYRWMRQKGGQLRNLLFTPTINWQFIDSKVQMKFIPEPDIKYIPDADAIFATAWPTAEIVENLPLTKGKKIYLIQSYETWNGPKDRVDATWQETNISKIVIAQWLYKKGLELHIPKNDLIHIPNAIDHSEYKIFTPINQRTKKVAMLYHPASIKGGDDGIKALQIAKEKFPELQVVLFSVIPRPKNTPHWIEYYHKPNQAFLIKSIYNESSIYLCSSWIEGWHLPPAEAMSCGCALVSTNIGGVQDYSEHGKTALLSEPKNALSLAKNLIYLLENDDIRIELANHGHRKIKEFTWNKSADSLEKFLLLKVANCE